MRVTVEMNSMGHLTLTPQSDKLRKKIVKHLKSMGVDNEDGTVYIQYDYDIEAFLENLPRSKVRDIQEGYGVTISMDEWTYGHYVGWDAHEALGGCDCEGTMQGVGDRYTEYQEDYHPRHLCSNCLQKFEDHRTSDRKCPGKKEPKWPTTIKDEDRAGEVFDKRMEKFWSENKTYFKPVI